MTTAEEQVAEGAAWLISIGYTRTPTYQWVGSGQVTSDIWRKETWPPFVHLGLNYWCFAEFTGASPEELVQRWLLSNTSRMKQERERLRKETRFFNYMQSFRNPIFYENFLYGKCYSERGRELFPVTPFPTKKGDALTYYLGPLTSEGLELASNKCPNSDECLHPEKEETMSEGLEKKEAMSERLSDLDGGRGYFDIEGFSFYIDYEFWAEGETRAEQRADMKAQLLHLIALCNNTIEKLNAEP
jgi:hypothetical protein